MNDPAAQVVSRNTNLRRAEGVAILLAVFLAALTFSLRGSFWNSNDYGLLSISHAIHLEWRLTHSEPIPAPGLAGHPGILFYLASWLALAVTMPSILSTGFVRFSDIVANAEAIYIANQAIAIVVVALSAGAFVRVASRIVPFGVILAALGLWFGASYQTVLTSTSLSIETFALSLNALFLWTLLRFTLSPKISMADSVIAGLVAASGYLMKLPYLYVGFGLIAAFATSCFLHRTGPIHTVKGLAIIVATFVLSVAVIGNLVIGSSGFDALLRFHLAVMLHSGYYGEGDPGVLQASHVKAAFNSFLTHGSIAPWVGLMLGGLCIAFAISGARSRKGPPSDMVLAVGAGVATLLASAGVLKHFVEHYAVGVASTLPLAVIALYLLVNRLQPGSSRRFEVLLAILLTFGVSNALYFAAKEKWIVASRRLETLEDRRQLTQLLHADEGKAFFTYRVPMPEFAEGFILLYAGVPQLLEQYRIQDRSRVSSFMHPTGWFKYVVLDKNYFPNPSAIRSAASLSPADGARIKFSTTDQIFELHCCFVIVKSQPFRLAVP